MILWNFPYLPSLPPGKSKRNFVVLGWRWLQGRQTTLHFIPSVVEPLYHPLCYDARLTNSQSSSYTDRTKSN